MIVLYDSKQRNNQAICKIINYRSPTFKYPRCSFFDFSNPIYDKSVRVSAYLFASDTELSTHEKWHIWVYYMSTLTFYLAQVLDQLLICYHRVFENLAEK